MARSQAPLRSNDRSDWNALRIRAGLSLRQLERACGINRGTLSLIDRGRLTPTPAECAKILAVLRPEHPGTHDEPALAQVRR